MCRDTDEENDGGVNNDPEVRTFLASVLANGNGQAPSVPLHLEVSSHNPATQPTARGVEFLQLHRPFVSPGKVRVAWSCTEAAVSSAPAAAPPWQLWTTNVRRLRLYPLAGGWNASCVPAAGLTVDSCEFSREEALSLLSGQRHLVAQTHPHVPGNLGCSWQLSGDTDSTDRASQGQLQRWPEAGGPARQLSSAGAFLTVVGTAGTSVNLTDHLQAGLFLANSHALGYNTYAPMTLDTEVGSQDQQQHLTRSKNLLLIGGVRHNAVTARWHAKAMADCNDNTQPSAPDRSGLAVLNELGGVTLPDGRDFSGPHTVRNLSSTLMVIVNGAQCFLPVLRSTN